MKIAFLLPQNIIGGGHLTVYKHASHLQSVGHDVAIIYRDYVPGRDQQMIGDFNFNILLFDEIFTAPPKFDVIFATWWETLYDIFIFESSYYFYYTQSDERRFYEDPKEIKLRFCELTYRFDKVGFIAVATWLQKMLLAEGGIRAKVVPNGFDPTVFNASDRKYEDGRKLRVLVEGHGNIWFRRIDDCFEALNGVENIEVWFVSRDGFTKPAWKYDKMYVNISSGEMAEVYSACDVLLKMSEVESFCLPNLEMMACGGSIITTNFTGQEEYAVNGYNSLVIPIRDVKAAREAVLKLRDDRTLLKTLQSNALATTINMTWDIQTNKFEAAMNELMDELKNYDYTNLRKRILLIREIKLAGEVSEMEKNKLARDYQDLFRQFHRKEYSAFRFAGRMIYGIPLLGPLLRRLFQ